jgi:hypothetical protein
MKRSRSQLSREMSPGVNDEGFSSRAENEGMLGVEQRNGSGKDNGLQHVIVAGAGPAGLMLAYVIGKCLGLSLLMLTVRIL